MRSPGEGVASVERQQISRQQDVRKADVLGRMEWRRTTPPPK
jgi:hypothetical protein